MKTIERFEHALGRVALWAPRRVEGGQVAALKYLWEMSGMFPFEVGENGERDSLAKILLARMGLQGKVPVIIGDEEGDVESEEDLQKSDRDL